MGAPSTSDRGGASALERRIAASVAGAALALLLAACAVFALQMRDMDARSLRTQARELSAILARQGGELIRDRPRASQVFAALAEAPSLREAILFDSRGEPVAAYSRSGGALVGVATLVEARSPVTVNGRAAGEVVVRAASHRFDPLFLSSLAICAALFFAAAAAALFLGRWLAARLLGPVNRLSSAMAQISESRDFTQLVPGVGSDELGRLTGSFNELLLRLQSNDRDLRRTLADLTEARDAAQAASIQKSQFLANMSHEIRTPLNGVLAMTQVMARGDLAAGQRKRLDVIRRSGETLLTVLNDVLDVSKIESGKLELEPVDIDVDQLVRDVVEGFHVLAEAKGLTLDLHITPAAAGSRRVDPLRLRQIIANLLSNAVKFTEAGGVVVAIDGEGPGGESGLTITVTDTGLGIDPQRLPYLFDKFIQGDSSTTRRFGGTGLGLSISRDLVQMMDGALWAQSEPGRGSTFHVTLPLARIHGAAPATATGPADDRTDAPGEAAAPLRVLAAEDNAANRMVLSTIMEVFGVSLETVDDGQEAVEAWRRGAFDLILMDVQMPKMDGVEATRVIRGAEAAEGRARTPIIALSANAMHHQVRDYLAAGMDAHVAKPIELNRLQEAIHAATRPPERLDAVRAG